MDLAGSGVPHRRRHVDRSGHGRICDIADVAYYRGYGDDHSRASRVQNLMKKDMSLDQVKAAKLTADWDPRYGSGERFIERCIRV